jgi:hypothetical protein
MTKVEFYFDPSCPFSWITSRWLCQVKSQRNIDAQWRPFSLALKNNELRAEEGETPHAATHRQSHRVQRIIAAVAVDNLVSADDLYSEFGMRFHILEQAFDDEMIRSVLSGKNLPISLLSAADDVQFDTFLQHEIESATAVVGNDVGVPIIVFETKNNEKLGYFGPVLNELPSTLDESLALWDGLEKLATTSSFYELKRSRSGGPNVFSAAKC